MVGLLLTAALGLTSCANDDNAAESAPAQPVASDPVAQWLSEIPGVSNVTLTIRGLGTAKPAKVYYFEFLQPIDHHEPSKGTFWQKVALTYKDADAYNLLGTAGYAVSNNPDSIAYPVLNDMLDGNFVTVEYRYFGSSLPEAFDDLYFTYLNSDQASLDLHRVVEALKQTGRFRGKWVASGTSKDGITAALYAYYGSKYGFDDMDLYVPFCAPFCERLDDSRVGKYLEEKSLAGSPEARQKLEQFAKSIAGGTPLTAYLVNKYRQQNADEVVAWRKQGFTEAQVDEFIIADRLVTNQHSLANKLSYLPISLWKGYIPDPTGETGLEYAEKFISWDKDSLMAYVEKQQKTTRAMLTYEQLLQQRQQDVTFPYRVQAMYELGYFRLTYDYLVGCPGVNMDYLKSIEDERHEASELPGYAQYYSDAMMKDFIYNYLPTAKQKMVFVYGGQDFWTGAAIPEPTNPNIRKFVVPGGVHNDIIHDPLYCPTETYQEIRKAIETVLLGN